MGKKKSKAKSPSAKDSEKDLRKQDKWEAEESGRKRKEKSGNSDRSHDQSEYISKAKYSKPRRSQRKQKIKADIEEEISYQGSSSADGKDHHSDYEDSSPGRNISVQADASSEQDIVSVQGTTELPATPQVAEIIAAAPLTELPQLP